MGCGTGQEEEEPDKTSAAAVENKAVCPCGAVTVTVTGPSAFCAYCHCSQCRKQTGAPYFNGVGFPTAQFKATGEVISHTQNKMARCSCKVCGTHVYSIPPEGTPLRIVANQLLEKPHEVTMGHIFTADKVVNLPEDGLSRFTDQTTKEETDTKLPVAEAQTSNSLSCACGKCTVKLEGAPLFGAFCHCSICRKATSSPFYNRFGYPVDKVTLTGDVITYKAKDMDRMSCKDCGSFVLSGPAPGGMMNIVPGANLDKRQPTQMHIWCDNKVVELPVDKLPRFPGNFEPPAAAEEAAPAAAEEAAPAAAE